MERACSKSSNSLYSSSLPFGAAASLAPCVCVCPATSPIAAMAAMTQNRRFMEDPPCAVSGWDLFEFPFEQCGHLLGIGLALRELHRLPHEVREGGRLAFQVILHRPLVLAQDLIVDGLQRRGIDNLLEPALFDEPPRILPALQRLDEEVLGHLAGNGAVVHQLYKMREPFGATFLGLRLAVLRVEMRQVVAHDPVGRRLRRRAAAQRTLE